MADLGFEVLANPLHIAAAAAEKIKRHGSGQLAPERSVMRQVSEHSAWLGFVIDAGKKKIAFGVGSHGESVQKIARNLALVVAVNEALVGEVRERELVPLHEVISLLLLAVKVREIGVGYEEREGKNLLPSALAIERLAGCEIGYACGLIKELGAELIGVGWTPGYGTHCNQFLFTGMTVTQQLRQQLLRALAALDSGELHVLVAGEYARVNGGVVKEVCLARSVAEILQV